MSAHKKRKRPAKTSAQLSLHYETLVAEGIVDSWTTLNRRIQFEDFPPGHMIGRRRAWTPDEVTNWIKQQPGDKREPRGNAKRLRDQARGGANASAT